MSYQKQPFVLVKDPKISVGNFQRIYIRKNHHRMNKRGVQGRGSKAEGIAYHSIGHKRQTRLERT